ncbi:MAG TPA: RNA polymerase sigma factor [Desulfobacteria bacterium]|nr:RNA polymerase sigma factor [Desulfobacteria bacterium]
MEKELLEIYDRYYDRVKRFITGLVKDEWIAEDLIQETFIRVQKNLESVRDPSKISSWIFRIAYNLCQDHFKSNKKNQHDEGKSVESLPNPFVQLQVQKELEQHQMGTCVQEQINLLPESQQIVLLLYDIVGYSHAEIAEVLDITIENAKIRLHRARKGLKSILKEKCTFQLDERNVLICEPLEKKIAESRL